VFQSFWLIMLLFFTLLIISASCLQFKFFLECSSCFSYIFKFSFSFVFIFLCSDLNVEVCINAVTKHTKRNTMLLVVWCYPPSMFLKWHRCLCINKLRLLRDWEWTFLFLLVFVDSMVLQSMWFSVWYHWNYWMPQRKSLDGNLFMFLIVLIC